MGGSLGVALEFVDVDKLKLGPVPRGAQRQAAHPPESVDPDPRAHVETLLLTAGPRCHSRADSTGRADGGGTSERTSDPNQRGRNHSAR